jgi:putative restriction endonuclease
MPPRTYGHIPGEPVGTLYPSRRELADAGVHRPLQAGISGSSIEPADSIVLSGGYEDDEDYGDEILYTGQGGRDPTTREQIADQELTRGNMGLALSRTHGHPVRVIRGASHDSPYSPQSGYRYDGLFQVVDAWYETGRSGHKVWRYRLVQIPDGAASAGIPARDPQLPLAPERRESTVLRIVRDTAKAREIKRLYDFTCQVCGIRLEGSAGPYAEAGHIRPLGAPHNGPDVLENLLCLCPNHHVLFDLGGFAIQDDYALLGLPGRLTVRPRHTINPAHLRYHREHYFS